MRRFRHARRASRPRRCRELGLKGSEDFLGIVTDEAQIRVSRMPLIHRRTVQDDLGAILFQECDEPVPQCSNLCAFADHFSVLEGRTSA